MTIGVRLFDHPQQTLDISGACVAYIIDIERRSARHMQYRFTLRPYSYDDCAEMCHYHQTSPQSHFTQGRICSRATGEGRITLSEMRLITTSKNGGRQERILASQEEYAAILREHFGIVMTG